MTRNNNNDSGKLSCNQTGEIVKNSSVDSTMIMCISENSWFNDSKLEKCKIGWWVSLKPASTETVANGKILW